jgi:hypothetical protein
LVLTEQLLHAAHNDPATAPATLRRDTEALKAASEALRSVLQDIDS